APPLDGPAGGHDPGPRRRPHRRAGHVRGADRARRAVRASPPHPIRGGDGPCRVVVSRSSSSASSGSTRWRAWRGRRSTTCGATAPRAEHRRGAKLLYIETDPVYEQLRIAAGEESSLAFLTSHDVLFTYGENLGAPDCPVPLERFAWRTTRPPVVLDCWAARTDPGAVFFTSIASWENKGKDITFRGETYQWSKHVNFLRFLDLPRHTPQRFCLAMDPADAAVEARVCGAGWELTDPRPISADVDAYRDFIYGSRGEFTVAKDIYVRPRSGWFSDRSVCYLAAGKPVVTQDTGFGKFVPTGQGLLAYSTMEEAVDALARVNRDYAAHGAAARRVAAEHFGAEPVLGRLLADAGLG